MPPERSDGASGRSPGRCSGADCPLVWRIRRSPSSRGCPSRAGLGRFERVADADRDRTVTQLREHVVEGRLTLDEFSERVGRALGARTRGDLDAVMADLPASARVVEPPADRRRRATQEAPLARGGHERPQHEGALAYQRQDQRGRGHGRLRHGPAAGRDRGPGGGDHRLRILGWRQRPRARGVRRGAAGLLVHGRTQPAPEGRGDRARLAPHRRARLRRHGRHRGEEPSQPVRPCARTAAAPKGRRRRTWSPATVSAPACGARRIVRRRHPTSRPTAR